MLDSEGKRIALIAALCCLFDVWDGTLPSCMAHISGYKCPKHSQTVALTVDGNGERFCFKDASQVF